MVWSWPQRIIGRRRGANSSDHDLSMGVSYKPVDLPMVFALAATNMGRKRGANASDCNALVGVSYKKTSSKKGLLISSILCDVKKA